MLPRRRGASVFLTFRVSFCDGWTQDSRKPEIRPPNHSLRALGQFAKEHAQTELHFISKKGLVMAQSRFVAVEKLGSSSPCSLPLVAAPLRPRDGAGSQSQHAHRAASPSPWHLKIAPENRGKAPPADCCQMSRVSSTKTARSAPQRHPGEGRGPVPCPASPSSLTKPLAPEKGPPIVVSGRQPRWSTIRP